MIDILVLVGETCVGKDSIKRELCNLGMKPFVTCTTRPMRDGEQDGVNYHFLSKSHFKELEKSGYFAETTAYNVASGETWYYGTAIEDLEKADDNTVVILNPEGFRKIKTIKGLDIVSFYITAKKSVIKRRLKKRGDNRKEARRRLKADKKDFKGIEDEVNYTIENNNLSTFESDVYLIDYIYKRHMKLKLR